MPLSTILGQPFPAYTLLAAYQTIGFSVIAPAGTNPVVYFDVYFNGVYYRTITTTTPLTTASSFDIFQVDIKDAVQEYLSSSVMDAKISTLTAKTDSVATCFVRMRGSSVTAGLVVPDGPIPVQGTVGIAPVSGGGLTSNTFLVLNMTLQHEDPIDAKAYLAATSYTTSSVYYFWALTRNEQISVTRDDYAYLPLYIHHNGFNGSGSASMRIVVQIEGNGTNYYPSGTGYTSYQDKTVYYLPIGLKNMALMSNYWGVPFGSAQRYRVGLELSGGGSVIAFITPFIDIIRTSDSHKRVFFRNHLGHYESLGFVGYAESSKAVSGIWEQALAQVPPFSGKNQVGAHRFNVRSNESGILYGSFNEDMMWLLSQLNDSPDVFLQWKGTYGQPDDLLPILMLDAELPTRKADERYSYDVAMPYVMANPNINTRN